MAVEDNPYVAMLQRNLPRLLALYQMDSADRLFGCGDRRYWGWKLMDFPNATFQGAALGLSRMVVAGHLPNGMDPGQITARIEAMIAVLPELMDHRGGLAEALPNEGSFCVTGLVLGDCVGALDVLGARLSSRRRQELLNAMAPMAEFLQKQDEYHGIISNHLASTALGMTRWAKATSDAAALERAALWIDRIRKHACPEGWMREYGGADPGYQSWCTSALAQIAAEAPELDTKELLQSSFGFLEAFAHADGSFSNGCGARITRFLFPGGAELMARNDPSAARLANFSRRFAAQNRHVSLDAIDEPNLAPLFNDITLAATAFMPLSDNALPEPVTRDFPKAGLMIRVVKERTVTVSVARGGWCATTAADRAQKLMPEPVCKTPRGGLLRAVNGRILSETSDVLTISAELAPVERMLPSASKFVILRLLSLTLFRSLRGGNLVKKLLAGLLMGTRNSATPRVERQINLQTGAVTDRVTTGDAKLLDQTRGFSPMHMASQGYWQYSDDTPAPT